MKEFAALVIFCLYFFTWGLSFVIHPLIGLVVTVFFFRFIYKILNGDYDSFLH